MKHIPIDLEFAYPKLTICASAAWATISPFINKYVFSDWDFLPFIVILVIVDTVTGIWKSVKKNDFSSYAFGAVLTKVILYALYFVVIHNLTNFSQNDFVITLFTWVQQLGYAAIIVREAVSIIENMGIISPGLIPKWILKRLRQFDKDGKFKDSDDANPNQQ